MAETLKARWKRILRKKTGKPKPAKAIEEVTVPPQA
jgi:hypothetical protein